MNEQEIARVVADAAHPVYDSTGKGMPIEVYQNALAHELESRGLTVESRRVPPGTYTGVKITRAQTVDMIVNELVVVECHVKGQYDPRWEAEALSHLRITGLKLAVVINFGEKSLRNGIRRVVNTEA